MCGALKRAEEEAVADCCTRPIVKEVAGTFCVGNEAGRQVRGLMLVRVALVPDSSGS